MDRGKYYRPDGSLFQGRSPQKPIVKKVSTPIALTCLWWGGKIETRKIGDKLQPRSKNLHSYETILNCSIFGETRLKTYSTEWDALIGHLDFVFKMAHNPIAIIKCFRRCLGF